MEKFIQFFKSRTNWVAVALIFFGQLQSSIGLYEQEFGVWFPFVTAFIGAAMMYLRSITTTALNEK